MSSTDDTSSEPAVENVVNHTHSEEHTHKPTNAFISVSTQTEDEAALRKNTVNSQEKLLANPRAKWAGSGVDDLHRITQPSTFLAQKMSNKSTGGFGALFKQGTVDMEAMQKYFLDLFSEDFEQQLAAEAAEGYQRKTTFGFLDVSPYVSNSVESIVQDSFSICFECMPREHWNWNIYLLPSYCIGVVIRYLILFPLRALSLATGVVLFFLIYLITLLFKDRNTQLYYQQKALQLLSFMWIASWSGVIKYHGSPPPRRANQVYVANHSSVLDIVVVLNYCVVCLVGQKQPGAIGFFQKYVLDCMNNLWFDRMDAKERTTMTSKIKAHIQDPTKPPLLVFPEGTCVNNEYAVMFKRGAFDLDAEVVPIAIKYNRLFGDAFWNSKLYSFPRHVVRLMTSWCVVADVWFLEPQTRRENESAVEFAARVKQAICDQAGLIPVPWDGYLKYFRPSEREKKARQAIYADVLCRRFGLEKPTPKPKEQPQKLEEKEEGKSIQPAEGAGEAKVEGRKEGEVKDAKEKKDD